MNRNLWRLTLILIVTVIVAIPALFPLVTRSPALMALPGVPRITKGAEKWYKLGTDLAGGTILVYRIKDPREVQLTDLTTNLKERLDSTGLKGYVIRPLGEDRVEIVMPETDQAEVEQVKDRVSHLGQLDFRILADSRRHQNLMEAAELSWPQKELTGGQFVPYGTWKPIPIEADPSAPKGKSSPDAAPVGKETLERAKTVTTPRVDDRETIWFRPLDTFNIPESKLGRYLVRVINGRKMILARWSPDDIKFPPGKVLTKVDDDGEHYVLLYLDEWDVKGEYLRNVGHDVQDNQLVLTFQFNAEGGRLFRQLTSAFKPDGDYQFLLGVVLDGRLRSAASIRSEIGDSGIIQGNFTQEEVQRHEKDFRAGKLPKSLDKHPIQERNIGPSLGAETIRAGINSMIAAVAIVVVFMLVYYRVAGIVAILTLSLNVLMTVGIMVFFGQTWTMPGLAALVLTVGVSVDANILIFERIREELDAKRPLGLALRTGFEKAWSTILDSNVTSILTGLILFIVGSDQVKGFAITLIIGLLCNMFTAVFVARTIFDLLYDSRRLRGLSMSRFLAHPNFPFLAWARPAILASLIVLVAGGIAVGVRGKRMLEIDFTGGTAAGIILKAPMEEAKVRKLAESAVKAPTVEEIRLTDVTPGTRFLIRTEAQDDDQTPPDQTVRAKLAKAFQDNLQVINVAPDGNPSEIASSDQLSPTLKPFVGGKKLELTVSPPQTLAFVERTIADSIRKVDKNTVDVRTLFAVVLADSPPPNVDIDSFERLPHDKFLLATKLNIDEVAKRVSADLSGAPLFDPYDQFGPQVATETQTRAVIAIVLSWLGIIGYIWIRFGSWTFGVGGVAALVHDVLMAVGLLAIGSIIASEVPAARFLMLTEMRIDLNIVAALLTLIGYSINDTIVIFDRVREMRGKSPNVTPDLVNRAINATLSRTIITALTAFISVFVLYVFGGQGIHGFAFVLFVGIISGTYSTIYIACPIMLWLEQWNARDSRKPAPVSQPAAAAS